MTVTSPAIALTAADAVLSLQRRRNGVLQWGIRLGIVSLRDELYINASRI